MASAVVVAARKQVVDDWRRAQASLARYMAMVEDGDMSDFVKELANSSAAAGPSFTAVSTNGRKRNAVADTDEDEAPKKKGRKSGPKKEKDPNAPKRPASAFIMFQNAVRDEMRSANPDLEYKEVTKQIGERWKGLSEDEKRPWSVAGSTAMDEYKEARKVYDLAHPELASSAKTPRPSSVTLADGEKPKKKRGRPSKADLEAKKALAGNSSAPAKKAAPLSAPVVASDDDSSSEESSEDTSDDSDEDDVVVQKKPLTAPIASSASSSEESDDSDEEPAPVKRPAPAPAPAATPSKQKAGKVKSSEKKARK